eukprot:11203240-Alexandrium_andersonii.AAC.1
MLRRRKLLSPPTSKLRPPSAWSAASPVTLSRGLARTVPRPLPSLVAPLPACFSSGARSTVPAQRVVRPSSAPSLVGH